MREEMRTTIFFPGLIGVCLVVAAERWGSGIGGFIVWEIPTSGLSCQIL
jgi:hypothetical protein